MVHRQIFRRESCAKRQAGSSPGSSSPPRAGKANTTARSYMGYYSFPCPTWRRGRNDPAMKKRATMMLEYLMADYAAESARRRLCGRALARLRSRGAGKMGGAVERFRLGAVRPGPSARSAVERHPLLRAGERLRAARDPPAHRHRPLAALHRIRTETHPQSLALFRRLARTGVQNHLRAAGIRRSVPIRAARCSPSRSTPGMSPGRFPTRAACRIPSSLSIRILHCTS